MGTQAEIALVVHGEMPDLVEPGGIEPPTSCMPCKRSPS